MATTIKNSAFKVKTGSVPNTLNIPPEKGAILFDESQGGPVIGDGVNWLTFAPSIDAISLAANGDVYSDSFTAGVPIEPVDFFSVIVYNYGTALTPSIPLQNVTINTNGSYRVNWSYRIKSSVPNTTLSFDVAVGGVALGAPIPNYIPRKNEWFTFTGQFVIPGLVATDILTLWAQTDKTANINRSDQAVGISLV
jgi:hypothetical protein